MDTLYSLIVSVSVVICLHISTLLDALVVSCALPVSTSDKQWWVLAEFVTVCSTVACHWSARLIPFRVVSSTARFICCASFPGCSQQASSMMDPLSSSELASTEMMSSFPSILFTNPSARAGYDTKSIFKWSLTGLNSEFSFS